MSNMFILHKKKKQNQKIIYYTDGLPQNTKSISEKILIFPSCSVPTKSHVYNFLVLEFNLARFHGMLWPTTMLWLYYVYRLFIYDIFEHGVSDFINKQDNTFW